MCTALLMLGYLVSAVWDFASLNIEWHPGQNVVVGSPSGSQGVREEEVIIIINYYYTLNIYIYYY